MIPNATLAAGATPGGAGRTDDASAVGGADGSGPVVSARNVTKTYDSPLPFSRSVEVLTGATLAAVGVALAVATAVFCRATTVR